MYSYGIILYEIYSRKFPFGKKTRFQIELDVVEGKRPDLPTDCPPFFMCVSRPLRKKNRLLGVRLFALRFSLLSPCSQFLRNLTTTCWSGIPSQRPSFAAVIEQLKTPIPITYRALANYSSEAPTRYAIFLLASVPAPPPPRLTVKKKREGGYRRCDVSRPSWRPQFRRRCEVLS